MRLGEEFPSFPERELVSAPHGQPLVRLGSVLIRKLALVSRDIVVPLVDLLPLINIPEQEVVSAAEPALCPDFERMIALALAWRECLEQARILWIRLQQRSHSDRSLIAQRSGKLVGRQI